MTSVDWIKPYPRRSDRRGRFQFSLRSMFVATTILAALAAIGARWGVLGVFFVFVGAAVVQLARGIFGRHDSAVASGGFALLVLFVVAIPLCQVAVWDGNKLIPLQFVVIDEVTGRPIAGATVRLRHIADLPTTVIPPGERGVQASAGADGRVVLNETFWTSGHSGWTENYGFVHFTNSDCWVQVSAPGFATFLTPLSTLTGQNRDIADPIPPPMQVGLHRVSAAGKK